MERFKCFFFVVIIMKKLLLLILLLVGCSTKPAGFDSYFTYDSDGDGLDDRFVLEWDLEYYGDVVVQKDLIYERDDGITAKVYIDIDSLVDEEFVYTYEMFTSLASSVDDLEFNAQPLIIDYPFLTWNMSLEAGKTERIVITSTKAQVLPFVFS